MAAQRADFASETTLASRTFAPWIKKLVEEGYTFHLLYLWLPSPDLATRRAPRPARRDSKAISSRSPEFFRLYTPIAKQWRFYDNSVHPGQRLVAEGSYDQELAVYDPILWQNVKEEFR